MALDSRADERDAIAAFQEGLGAAGNVTLARVSYFMGHETARVVLRVESPKMKEPLDIPFLITLSSAWKAELKAQGAKLAERLIRGGC